jgi:hypothetical protein
MRALISIALVLGVALGACDGDDVMPGTARLRLARRPAGRIAIEVTSDVSPRALQVELAVEGGAVEDPQPPDGVPLDTVRAKSAGAGLARLFAGDKRGVRLSQDGEVATFTAPSAASIRIVSAVLVDASGHPIPVETGGSLSLR